ncbi:MAG: SdrD B-like domain-containing protein, partial [Methanomassiliicoccales archaeon]
MSRKAKLLAAMVALTVLLAALAAAFDQVARVPVLTHPLSGNDPGTGGADGSDKVPSVADTIAANSSGPLLRLLGVTGTSYLKLMAYEIASDGTWYPLTGGQQSLAGGSVSISLPMSTGLMSNRSTQVTMLKDVAGPMPTFESTYRITDASGDLIYDSASGVLISSSSGRPVYQLLHQQPMGANMSTLGSLNCSSTDDQELPPQLAERLRQLSDLVSDDLTSPFAKAMALAHFLASSYGMTAGEDNGTIADFLFGDHTGDSKDFATAFTLLLRSQGIPARPCLTFKISPTLATQLVAPNSLSYAVEVNFDQLGWVMLDPASSQSDGTLHDGDSSPSFSPIFPDRPQNLEGIYGKVFLDVSGDGNLQSGEEGVSDVGVQLFNVQGQLLDTVQSDGLGHYLFEGAAPGSYTIHLLVPQDHIMTSANDQEFRYTSGLAHAYELGIKNVNPQQTRVVTVTQIISATPDIRKGALFEVTGTCTEKPQGGSTPMVETGMVQVYLVRSKENANERYLCGGGAVSNGYYVVTCMTPDEMSTGNYQLIVYYLGDAVHAPSDSDPSVRVLDSSTLLLEAMQPAMAGSSVSIKATLTEVVSGRPVASATVVFEFVAPWGHSLVSYVTDNEGMVLISYPLATAGLVYLEARFAGTALLNESSASLDFYSFPPALTLDAGSLVRGQDGTVFGRLSAGDIPVPGVRVNISSDLGAPRPVTTVAQGLFSLQLNVPADAALGNHTFRFEVRGFVLSYEVSVVSSTRLVLNYSGGIVAIQLLDDKGATLTGMDLQVVGGSATSSLFIGSSGVSQFQPAAPGNHSVLFAGDQRYAASIAYLNVDAPASTFPWWLLVVAGAAAILLAAFLIVRSRRTGPMSPRPKEEPRGPYQIGFPQILHPLPPVWGAGEPLKIAVQGRPGVVRMR